MTASRRACIMNGEKVSSIQDIINYYGIGKFTFKLMGLLGIICVGFGAISSTFTNSIPLIWQCHGIYLNPKITLAVIAAGYAFGSISYGWLADRIGRKIMIIFTTATCWYFSFLVSVSRVDGFLFLNLFFTSSGFYGHHIMTSYASEAFPERYRPKLQIYLGVCSAIGACISPILAWFINLSIHQLIFAISIPLTTCLILPCLFPESIAYLQITGKQEELLSIFMQLAKDHKKKLPMKCRISTKYMPQRGNLSPFFNSRKIIKTFFFVSMWITCFLLLFASTALQSDILEKRYDCKTYPARAYTRVCSLQALTADKFLTNIYGAISNLFGHFLCFLLIDTMNRRKLFIGCFGFVGIGFLLLDFCLNYKTHRLIMLFTKALCSALSQLLFISTNESFPVHVRCTMTGFLSFFASLFTVFTIVVEKNLFKTAFSNFYFIICICICILILLLKLDKRFNS